MLYRSKPAEKIKQRALAFTLLCTCLIQPLEGNLTQLATVTADSVYDAGDQAYGNCLWGLVDGKWPPRGFSPTTHCVAHNNPTTKHSWFNINMGSKTVVQTVMIINREECCPERITGSDLYVGDNNLPYLNTPCGAKPQSTGVYSCGGKIGQYLGIYKNSQTTMNISQIRAYSYAANAYPNYQYLKSEIAVNYAQCSTTTSNLVFTNSHFYLSQCKDTVKGVPAYFNVVFDVARYVHVVTIVGNNTSNSLYLDFIDSKNWFVTVGDQTGPLITQNTVYGQYENNDFDRCGKEIKVGANGKSVGVFRNDGQVLKLRWIAIFTTMNDCSGPFDWQDSRSDWKIPQTSTAQVVTGKLGAKIDDCAVFHAKLVLSDDSPLPTFITYDVNTHIVTVNISTNQPAARITVKACAYLNDKGTTAKQECRNTDIEIVTAVSVTSVSFASPSQYFEVEQFNAAELQLPAISWLPTDATKFSFLFALANTLSYFSLKQGQNRASLIISGNLVAGTYLVQVIVTDQLTQTSTNLSVTLFVYNCNPTGFMITPNSLTIEISGESKESKLAWDQLYSSCGNYSVQVQEGFANLLTIIDKTIVAQAPETAQEGTLSPIFTLKRDNNAVFYSTVALTLTTIAKVFVTAVTCPSELNASFGFKAIITGQVQITLSRSSTEAVNIEFTIFKGGLEINPFPSWFSQDQTDKKIFSITQKLIQKENKGTYQIKADLFVINNSRIKQACNFSLKITNPCETATLSVSSYTVPYKLTFYVLSRDPQIVPPFTLTSTTEALCAINVSASQQRYLTALEENKKLTITIQKGNLIADMPASIKTHEFTINMQLADGSTITQFQLNLDVRTPTIKTEGAIANQVFELNQQDKQSKILTLPTYLTEPVLSSEYVIRRSLFMITANSIQAALPSWITFDDANIIIRIDQPSARGIYSFQVNASVDTFNYIRNEEVKFNVTLQCTINKFYLAQKNVINQVYTISPGSETVFTMQIPAYGTEPSFCLMDPVKIALSLNGDLNIPSFITLSLNEIKIMTNDVALAGTYAFTVTAVLDAVYPTVKFTNSSATFHVQINCTIINLRPVKTDQANSIDFELRSGHTIIKMPEYTWEPKACAKQFSYKLKNVTIGADANVLPIFLAFDEKQRQVTLKGNPSNKVYKDQELSFKLVVTEKDGGITDSSFGFQIKTTFKNTAPVFKEALSSQTVKIGQSLNWNLPEIVDSEGDSVSKMVVKTNSHSWLAYSESSKSFSVDTKSLKEDSAGRYQVDITIADEHNAESRYKQEIILQNFVNSTALNETNTENETKPSTNIIVPEFNPANWTQTKQQKQKQEYLPPLRLDIVGSNDDGTIQLYFNRKVEINPLLLQEIKKLTNQGKRQLQGQSKQELEEIKLLLKDAFQITYKPLSEEQPAVLLDYNIVEFKDLQEITILLNFDKPLLVSSESKEESQNDRVDLNFKNNNIFLDPATMIPLPKDVLAQEVVTIPRQQATFLQAQTIKSITAISENVAMVVVPGNFVIGIILGISLKKVWSAVNALQFLIYFRFWNMSFPANTQKLVNFVSFISRGEFIPKEKIMNKVLALVRIAKSNDKIVMFTRFLIMILVSVIIMAALVSLLVYLCRNRESRIARALVNVKDKIFWNIILRTVIQMYLDLCISSMVIVSLGVKQPISGLAINISIMVVMFIVPFIFWAIIKRNFQHLNTTEAVKKFGALIQGVNTRSVSKTTYTVVFLLRRFLFAVVTAFIAKRNNSIGLILVAYLNLAIQMYTVEVSPLESKSSNMTELATEVLLHYTFLSFVFIQLQFSPISAQNAGWGTVFIVLTMVVLNLSIMIYHMVSNLIRKLRLWYHSRVNRQRLAAFDVGRKEQLEMLQRFDSEMNREANIRACELEEKQRLERASKLRTYKIERRTPDQLCDDYQNAQKAQKNKAPTIQGVRAEAVEKSVGFVDTWDDDSSPVVLRNYKTMNHDRNQSQDQLLVPSVIKNVNDRPENDLQLNINGYNLSFEDSPRQDKNNKDTKAEVTQTNPDYLDEYIQQALKNQPEQGYSPGSAISQQERQTLNRKMQSKAKQQVPQEKKNAWGLQTLAAINFGRAKRR